MANENAGKQDPEEIRREIERTRSHMERNIDALQSRLSPDRLKDEATAKIREQTVGRVEGLADNATETVKGAGANVFETIKHNPFPAALAAIGLGWLFMETRNNSRLQSYRGQRFYGERYGRGPESYQGGYRRDYPQFTDRYYPEPGSRMQGRAEEMRGAAAGMTDQARDTVRQAASSVSGTASQVAGSVTDTASQVASNVTDTASQVASNVGDTASQLSNQAREQVSEFADTAQRGASQVKSWFQDMMDENPLLMGAAAVAVGAAIGLSLPHTQQEDQLLGQARDSFMEKAQEQAQQTMDKVQQVAQRAGDAAKEEAQNQQLTK